MGDGAERPGPLEQPHDDRQAAALAVVVEHGAAAGLDVAGAGIWRAGSAVLIGLPAVPALARVDEPARAADAARQVAVAEVLAVAGVPAVQVVGPPEQPVATPAGPLTIWRWVPPTGPPIDARTIGEVARRLHDRTRHLAVGGAAPGAVPAHDPLGAVAAELDRAAAGGATAAVDLDLLRRRVDALAASWPAAGDDPLGPAVVHGDLHRANVVPGPDGPVLADLELAGWGPASADLAPQAVAVRRYGAPPEELDQALAGYGADPRGWPGFDVLVEGYELWVTVWAVANRTASARVEHEAQLRLERWRTGASAPWSLR